MKIKEKIIELFNDLGISPEKWPNYTNASEFAHTINRPFVEENETWLTEVNCPLEETEVEDA